MALDHRRMAPAKGRSKPRPGLARAELAEPIIEKWPARWRVLFVVAAAAGLWAAIGWTVAALF